MAGGRPTPTSIARTASFLPHRLLFLLTVVVFCMCVLNLFIAVQEQAYDLAQESAFVEFIRERAGVCLKALVQLNLPRAWLALRYPCLTAGVVLATGLTGAVVLVITTGWVWPSALLGLLAVLLGDLVLLQRPWQNHSGCHRWPCRECRGGQAPSQNFLWICHRADFDETKLFRHLGSVQED